jgi:hypothetical protein
MHVATNGVESHLSPHRLPSPLITTYLGRADRHVADARTSALDEPVRVGEQRAVRELEVDPAGVRDEREQRVAHPHAPAEGEQAVARVELDDDLGYLVADELLERRAAPWTSGV